MATRLFLHDANSDVSGTLPSTEQSSNSTATYNLASQSLNKKMDTTKGTTQTSLSASVALGLSQSTVYSSKWVSPPLASNVTIAANTWTINFAAKSGSDPYYPYRMQPNVYIWRPSTGAKVGTIFDSNAGAPYGSGNVNETSKQQTFSGSAVSALAGDVIIVEAWCAAISFSPGTFSIFFYYDGATETASDGTTVTNHASFLETPQNLTFQAGGSPVTMDVTDTIVLTNKFITKV